MKKGGFKFDRRVPTPDNFHPSFEDGVDVAVSVEGTDLTISVWGEDDYGLHLTKAFETKADAKTAFRSEKRRVSLMKEIRLQDLIGKGFKQP